MTERNFELAVEEIFAGKIFFYGGGRCGKHDKIFSAVKAHENFETLSAPLDADGCANIEQVKFGQFFDGGFRQKFSQIILPVRNFIAVADNNNGRARIFCEGGGNRNGFLRTGDPVN